MHTKRNSLLLTIAIFAAFLVFGVSSPHIVHAQDACVSPGVDSADSDTDDAGGNPVSQNPSNVSDPNGNPYGVPGNYPNYSGGPPPGAINGLGGYGGPINDSDFFNGYTNSATNIVQGRQLAKHKHVQNSNSIDAKLHYCFDSLKLVFGTLNLTSTGNIVQHIVALLLHAILMALVGIICSLIMGIVADLKTLLNVANNLLCLPIPKLHLPRFHIPGFNAGHCNGISLAKFTTTAVGTGTQQKVLWHIWGKQQQQ